MTPHPSNPKPEARNPKPEPALRFPVSPFPRFHLPLLLLLLPFSLAAAPTTLPAFRSGGPLLGSAPPIAPPPMAVKWTYKTGADADRAPIQASPVVANDTIYLADARGTLHAIDLQTGKPKWQYKTDESFATTPLVLDNKVFIGDLLGVFHAVSADTGQKIWTLDTESPINSSANSDGQRIFFANDAAQMFCVSTAGKVLWKATGGDRINSAPAVAPAPPSTQPAPFHPTPPLAAYFGGCDGHLRAFDTHTGQELFAIDLAAPIPSSPAIVGDLAVVGTDLGRVHCVSLTKRQVLWSWQNPTSEMLVYASPAVADNIVVVGSRDRQIHALDLLTGKLLWSFKTRGDCDASPVISSSRVYAPSKDKNLYVLDLKTGTLLWTFNAARPIEASPTISNNLILLPDTSGTLFCLQPR